MRAMTRFLSTIILVALAIGSAIPQSLIERQKKIKNAVETREYPVAITELVDIEKADPKAFQSSDQDYLLARMEESNSELAPAMATYQQVVSRDSPLRAYALMHLSQIVRSTGNLILERLYLQYCQRRQC